jgi:hypothetical protein
VPVAVPIAVKNVLPNVGVNVFPLIPRDVIAFPVPVAVPIVVTTFDKSGYYVSNSRN